MRKWILNIWTKESCSLLKHLQKPITFNKPRSKSYKPAKDKIKKFCEEKKNKNGYLEHIYIEREVWSSQGMRGNEFETLGYYSWIYIKF